MVKVSIVLSFLLPLFCSLNSALAGNGQPKSKPDLTVHIGYVGLNTMPGTPHVKVNGDLGAVFYVADSVDLARVFARGSDADKAHICKVKVSRSAWTAAPKIWVAPSIFDGGGRAVDGAYPGPDVRFAPQFRFRLPKGAPAITFQLGIKKDQLAALGIKMDCFPKSAFAGKHDAVDYGAMTKKWNIKQDWRQWEWENGFGHH